MAAVLVMAVAMPVVRKADAQVVVRHVDTPEPAVIATTNAVRWLAGRWQADMASHA